MRTVVKIEDNIGQGKGEEDAGRAKRPRLNVGGVALLDEMRSLWAQAQTLAIKGTYQTQAMWEDLLQANARIAELTAELLAKDAVIHRLHADLARRDASRRLPAPVQVEGGATATEDAESLFQESLRLYGEQRFSDTAKCWGQAALLNHAASHAFLSSMLLEGRKDVPMDDKRAFQLASAGAALGCAHSKGMLGRCYVLGRGVAANVERGLALGRDSLAGGSCFGQNLLGMCHEEGWGVAQDFVEAARLYRLAAAQGHALAQNDLAALYEKGSGVEKDDTEAARLYRLAAAQGHAVAQFNLGTMFESGEGVGRDDAEALRLYHLAAAQGHAVAQNNLGFMYEKGRGVAQDRTVAIQWYRLAAAQRITTASAALKRLRK